MVRYIKYRQKLVSNFYKAIEETLKNLRKNFMNTGLSSELLTPILTDHIYNELVKRIKNEKQYFETELNVLYCFAIYLLMFKSVK